MILSEGKEVTLTANRWGDWKTWARQGYPDLIGNQLEVNPAVKLLYSNELKYSINNNTSKPFESAINAVANSNLIAGVAAAASFTAGLTNDTTKIAGFSKDTAINPWIKNLAAYTGTDPIQINPTFSFHLGEFDLWDAKEEVVKPILALLTPAIPRSYNMLTIDGPFASASGLMGALLANFAGSLNGASASTNEGGVTSLVNNLITQAINAAESAASESSSYVNMNIGERFYLGKALYTKAEVTFSEKLDTEGFPISGSITLTLVSNRPPARRPGPAGTNNPRDTYRFWSDKLK
jgi:hypothetical protein